MSGRRCCSVHRLPQNQRELRDLACASLGMVDDYDAPYREPEIGAWIDRSDLLPVVMELEAAHVPDRWEQVGLEHWRDAVEVERRYVAACQRQREREVERDGCEGDAGGGVGW